MPKLTARPGSSLVFKNYGGSYQLRIQDARDLENIQVLDDVHWAATSISTDSLNCDPAFTSYLDGDKNGRIRSDEVKAAQAWLFRFLGNRSRLSEGSDILRFSDIDTTHPEGQKLQIAAELVLTNLNVLGAEEISLAQVRDVKSIMANAANNGDGVIPPAATADSDLAQFIVAVIETVGSTMDACGKPGISEKQVKEFFQAAEDYLAWKAKGEIPPGEETTEVMPWGTETPPAYQLVVSLETKIEQYFAQCAMVRFDERTAAQMQLRQKELEEIDFRDKSAMEARLKDAPIAAPDPKGILDFEATLNPLYLERLVELKEKVLKRALGEPVKQLTEKQWEQVKSIFVLYRTWLGSKQGAKVEKLGAERLQTYLGGPYREKISELIAKDLAAADELDQIHNLEKLILYQRWLMELANNFVSFTNLYNPERRALIEMGTLVIEGREITLTMKVRDRQAHKKIAAQSYMYLLYLQITGRRDKDIDPSTTLRVNGKQSQTIKFEIVAAVTSGDAGGLRIGKRGVFFTLDGQEWDAEVIDIVVNPISLWESVKSPFQRIGGLIGKQVDKFTKSRQTKLEATTSRPSASGVSRDLLLGGGIAIAALGSAFAYITKALSQVKPVHILGALVGIGALILLPGIIIGFAKIRKRDMSVLLEALGWAVNVNMRLNTTLGRLFTHVPHLPKGARKEQKDVVAGFVKKFAYTPLPSRKRALMVLIISLIILILILVLYTCRSLELYLM
ncbi:MAG: hypothetical protein GXO98_05555 [Nitrospirae bacterium]|nr:hypothetical protein [Nitrospirota bacterium]